MILKIVSFTPRGEEIEQLIKEKMADDVFLSKKDSESLDKWTADAFKKRLPVVFIGAVGIAVRVISPYVTNKLFDSPVIVLDELGKFVIPVLSGHVGGGNEIARKIASSTGAFPVISTATDLEKKFAVDVFAVKNQLMILNRDRIKTVSSKILNGGGLKVYLSPGIKIDGPLLENLPEGLTLFRERNDIADFDVEIDSYLSLICKYDLESEDINALLLTPRRFSVGIGCKKGKSFSQLRKFVEAVFEENYLDLADIASFSSIDLKAKEKGLLILSQYFNVPFYTFPAGELESVQGEFSSSDFVKDVTGVSNVCERAAVLSSEGDCSDLAVKKTSYDGMTLAVAVRKPKITTWW